MKKSQFSSIRVRLLAVVVLAAVLALAIGAVAHLSLAKVSASTQDIVDRANPAIALGGTRTSWAQFENVVNGAITVNSEDGKVAAYRDADEHIAGLRAGISEYLAGNPGAEQKKIVLEKVSPNAEAAIQAWRTDIKPLTSVTQVDVSQMTEFNRVRTETFDTPAYIVNLALDQVAVLDQASIEGTITDADSTANRSVLQMWAMALIGAVVMLGFGIALAASITRPLRKTVAVLEEVANGDLTQRLDVTRDDELGQMATALNTTLSTVHDVVAQLESDADRLLTFANRVSDDSTSASDAVAKVSEQLGKVQKSSEQIGSSVRELADVKAAKLAPSVDAIAKQVSALHETLAGAELSEAVTSGADLTNENKATAAELAELAGNLNAMISLFVLQRDEPADATETADDEQDVVIS
jgi:methyl-accepting chemotaxis protein